MCTIQSVYAESEAGLINFLLLEQKEISQLLIKN